MGTDEKNSVIHRKAMGGRTEFDARVMSPSKALRLALAKCGAQMFDLAITVTTVEQVKLPHAGVQKEAGDDGLLLLFDGAAGARAAIKIDCQILTALIEVQTMGSVRRAEAEVRPFTPTDAAIVAPLLDAVLDRYDAQLAEADPAFIRRQYRFGDLIEDARSLSLALEAPEFDLFRLTLDVGEGAKTGFLTLMLPSIVPAAAARKPGEKPDKSGFSLKKAALEVPVAMGVVLDRIRMPLSDICALKPGALLPLDADCLGKAQLVAGDGQVVARVNMGQMNGMRAVRLVADGIAAGGPKQAAVPGASPGTGAGAATENMPDDVLDGIAQPVPAAADAPPAPDTGATPGDADTLSAADLMLATAGTDIATEDPHEQA